MELQEKIKGIKDYFKEMQIQTVDGKQIMYVIISFPHGWVIENDLDKKYNITILKQDNNYVFCCDIEDGVDNVFSAIEYSVTRMKEVIERANLLAEKTRELKSLFEDESISIESLRELSFTYQKPHISDIDTMLNNIGKDLSNNLNQDESESDNKKKEIKETR